MNALNIGLLGYGSIGRVHAMSYRQLPFMYPGTLPLLNLHSVCTTRTETAEAAKAEAGFEHALTDSDLLISDSDVQLIDVSLPNHLHLPAVAAALSAGKHVYCEKPLAGNIADARGIVRAVESSRGSFGMVFQYRYIPALMKAQEMIQDGAIGRIYTFRAEYLHSGYQNPARPLSWRMKKEEGGSGALGDLGSHVIDLVRYLIGEFDSLQGHLETFIDHRPVSPGSAQTGKVTVDDVAWLRARMKNGSIGTIEASRFATGTLDDLRIWIYGERGAFRFDLMDANFLYWFDESHASGQYGGSRGWQRLDTVANYPGAKMPPARAPLGWARAHAESQYRFITAIARGEEPSPGIIDGLRTQLVIDAVERSAADNGSWVEIEQE